MVVRKGRGGDGMGGDGRGWEGMGGDGRGWEGRGGVESGGSPGIVCSSKCKE